MNAVISLPKKPSLHYHALWRFFCTMKVPVQCQTDNGSGRSYT